MIQDVIKELASRCILENNANISIGFNHVYQSHNVGVVNAAENGDFALNLGQPRRVMANGISFDKFDGNLYISLALPQLPKGVRPCQVLRGNGVSKTHLHVAILLPSQLYFAKLSLTNSISQDEVAKLGGCLVVATMVVSASTTSSLLLGACIHGYNGGRCRWIVVVVG